jgi:hypothetical protein
VQHRNLAERDRDPWTAWNENVILERFYSPVLDLGARWRPEQREQMARAAQAVHRAGYVSAAEPYPIYVVNRGILWLVILTGGVLLLWAASRGGRA